MFTGDIAGVLIVYLYVSALLLIFDFFLKNDPFKNRKLIHILVGNIIFVVPIFETRWVMVLLAAAPFILITYLISPKSFLTSNSKVSGIGHASGLIYYSISWTILAFLFFDHPGVIAVGILCMSYGDGLASLVGKKYGKHRLKGNKTFEGSGAMFLSSTVMIFLVLYYFDSMPGTFLIIPFVAGIATIVEIFSVKGLDNFFVAMISSITYYILVHL